MRALLALCFALIASLAHADVVLGLVANRSIEETQLDWEPIAEDLARRLGEPVRVVASKDEAELLRALKAGEIDVLRGSTQLALQAVEGGSGDIFARLVLTGRIAEYRSLLLVRQNGPATLDELLKRSGQLRYASGSPGSTAGSLIPGYHAFARNNVLPERFFKSVTTGNSEDRFRALVENRTDVATSNSDDLIKLAEKYPRDFKQVRVLWESPKFSYDPLVLRRGLSAGKKEKITRFFLDYGRKGMEATREKERLYYADQLDGFLASSNRQLREVTDLQLYDALFRLTLEEKLAAAARAEREKSLYRRYDQLIALLGGAR
ncbi:PhnD/SsuA/transferrin family substrate-binding protein [Chitinolyticbacter meiyuanensis]|uniref:PhnD/SsuA/transferrin family substrate-binding protein n=1 Tax=Chitinolyticbacter meiyuanensis TaxID=682798 RepID=UPI0011E5D7DD|nr:PhnD/SsuA/transferrin family substrate-binding protein [Chitinolyticbacter meiyuanensis]